MSKNIFSRLPHQKSAIKKITESWAAASSSENCSNYIRVARTYLQMYNYENSNVAEMQFCYG
jgi:hypothetical protein